MQAFITTHPDTPRDTLFNNMVTYFKKECKNRLLTREILEYLTIENFESVYTEMTTPRGGEDVREKTVGVTLSDAAIDEVIHNCYEEGPRFKEGTTLTKGQRTIQEGVVK